MREIRLYGHLGSRFGRVFQLDVTSPAEAVHALAIQNAIFQFNPIS